ncbi:MAG: hypothetical protein MUF64_30550 [Polyangiaceae bacterium]|jgi:hypothetical protein|nr:hypothetical protein [Polyangiaceae bacterium]
MGTARYSGEERRHHKVYITKNTEYHVRAGQVVAVRPRGSKTWMRRHKALAMKLEGHIEVGTLIPHPGAPRPGQRLFLAVEDNDVITSPVVAIVRPPRSTVVEYPSDEELALSA